MVLDLNEYDASYFDGARQRVSHNAGYSIYERVRRFDGPASTGELWQDRARDLIARFDLVGKRVMDLGCAKGFVVEDLRSLGVDAYGCDVSGYAISQSSVLIRPYLLHGEAQVVLREFPDNQFDFITSRGFIECVDPTRLPALIVEINRTAKKQAHFIHTDINLNFYTRLPLDEWARYGWKSGTVLIGIEGSIERVI